MENCKKVIFENGDFTNVECLKLFVSKFLGYAIVLGAMVVKLPQILKIISAKSTAGIDPLMFILETISVTITVAYNVNLGYPFSTYGESFFIMLQGWILVFLMASYNNALNAKFFAGSAVYAIGSYALFGGLVTSEQLGFLQSSTIFLMLVARGPQILTNFKQKSTGQLAFITLLMNFAGVFARVFTTLQEVDDSIILFSVGMATLINGTLLFQCLMYWNSPVAAPDKAAAGQSKKKKASKKDR